jgi:hypothetical protein
VELREEEGEFLVYEAGIMQLGAQEFWAERWLAGPFALLTDANQAADRYAAVEGLEVHALEDWDEEDEAA